MDKYDMKMETDPKTIPGKMMNRIQTNSVVLEFGCAFGRMTKYMKEELHCKVYVVEIDKKSYSHAIQFAAGGFCGDIEAGKWYEHFKELRFDYILFADVLEHLKQPETTLTLAKELLKDKGEVIISIPNICHSDIISNLYLNRFQYTNIGLLDNTHIHFWGKENLKSLANESGYEIRLLDGVYQNIGCTEQHIDLNKLPEHLRNALIKREYSDVYQFFLVLNKKEWFRENEYTMEERLKNSATALAVNVYWDTGEGYQPDQYVSIVPTVLPDHKLCFHCNQIPKNCVKVRFDPTLNHYCIVSDIHVITDVSSCPIHPLNGVQFNGVIVFGTMNPQMEFDVPKGAVWFEITANIEWYSGAEIEKVFTAVQDLPKLKQMEGCQTLINRLTEDLQALQRHSDSLQEQLAATEHAKRTSERQVERLQNERHALMNKENQLNDEILRLRQSLMDAQQYAQIMELQFSTIANARLWKISAPLRKMLDTFKSTRSGYLLHKTASSIVHIGIGPTIKKIRHHVKTEDTNILPKKVEDGYEVHSIAAFSEEVTKIGGKIYDPFNVLYDETGSKKYVLLISHEMNLTGAPIALGYFAESLQRQGYQPIIACRHDDVFKKQLLDKGIPVIIFSLIYTSKLIPLNTHLFKFIVINTIVGAPLVSQLSGMTIPVLWWIHEAVVSYHPGALQTMPHIVSKNIHIYCGGSYAEMVLHQFRPEYDIKQLLYYVPDYSGIENSNHSILSNTNGKKVFAMIGMQEKRKGYDVLTCAILNLPKNILNDCYFVFVGKTCDPEMSTAVSSLLENYPDNTQYIEELSRTELISFYRQLDCLICASRDDPMPVVVTEALMMSKPVICSENTGCASILEETNGGLVYRNNDPFELAQCIEYIYNNIGPNLQPMCQRARKTYERYFTQEMFDKAIYDITNNMISCTANQILFDGTVSVVIPVYNAGSNFSELLQLLKEQIGIGRIEIIIVDSGSIDDSDKLAEKIGAKVIRISQADFSHSYARNLGAEASTGEYLLFMTQDALPNGRHWILDLLQPVLRGEVVAVSCKEKPRPECDLLGRCSSWYHSEFMGILSNNRIMKLPEKQNYEMLRRNGQLNDVSCLIKHDVFNKFKYQGDYAEDLDLGIRLIRAGYKIALLSDVQVIHSHTRPAIYHFKRCLVDAIVLKRILPDMVLENVTAQTIVNRIISAYCVGSLYVSNAAQHTVENETWSEFCDWTKSNKLICVAKVKHSSTSEIRGMLKDGAYAQYDTKFAQVVQHMFDAYADCFAFDGCAVEDQFYYITVTLSRYFSMMNERFDEDKKNEILDLMVKHLGMLSGNMLAAYTVAYPNDDGEMHNIVETYRQGI